MGSRPRSPSPAPWWGPQPTGPGPAKRRRPDAPADPEPEATPVLEGPAGPGAADALTSVLVLAAGCALQVPLGDAELVLAPEPTSVLHVSLGAHTLVLVPEALLDPGDDRPAGDGASPGRPGPGPLLGAPEPKVVVEQGFFCAAALEADEEDVETEYLEPWLEPRDSGAAPCCSARSVPSPCSLGRVPEPCPRAPAPSPERRSPGPDFNLDFHLGRPLPDSPLQPLPPSPSPEPRERPQRPPRPPCRVRRRLFQE
ncbi:proline-rich protein 23C-like [Tamandua tetradactyla]|uniref:proline-rich protein 23C-like n=1 Tax=Tamandua tetradactyla TaxID=48850 RepID=UPI004054675D